MPAADHLPLPERAAAMRLFALSSWTDLAALTEVFSVAPHEVLRGPETGLVMLRGRMGSTGAPFNTGEATVTRCTVRLESGTEGHAYVLGRDQGHARRAALCDALYQDEPQRFGATLRHLDDILQQQRQEMAAKAAATKVDFFTMVRGDV